MVIIHTHTTYQKRSVGSKAMSSENGMTDNTKQAIAKHSRAYKKKS